MGEGEPSAVGRLSSRPLGGPRGHFPQGPLINKRYNPTRNLYRSLCDGLSVDKLARFVLIGMGTLCVALGVVGIFAPILPTTPFLLLAAFFYARSSQRFLNWLLTNRWFGGYIKNYREGHGIPRREKVLTIMALWLTVGLSALYAVSLWWARALLIAVAVGVTFHLLRIKTFNQHSDPGRVDDLRSPEEVELEGGSPHDGVA